jgi:hypothetical protein
MTRIGEGAVPVDQRDDAEIDILNANGPAITATNHRVRSEQMGSLGRRCALRQLIGMFGAARILGAQNEHDSPPLDDALLEPVNVMEFGKLAQRKLDPAAWDYLEGGAEEEAALRDNIDAYKKIIIRPKALTGVGKIDTSLELFGVKLDYPIMLDPMGGKTCFWPNGEIVTGQAAARSKTVYVSNGITELTKTGNGPANFYLTTNLGPNRKRTWCGWRKSRGRAPSYSPSIFSFTRTRSVISAIISTVAGADRECRRAILRAGCRRPLPRNGCMWPTGSWTPPMSVRRPGKTLRNWFR